LKNVAKKNFVPRLDKRNKSLSGFQPQNNVSKTELSALLASKNRQVPKISIKTLTMTEALFVLTKDQPLTTHLSLLTTNRPRTETVSFQSLIMELFTMAVLLGSPPDQMSAGHTTLNQQ
jgi:hypothetical protein